MRFFTYLSFISLFLCLGLNAESPWIFTKIKGKGSLFSKDRYLRHYSIEPGDPFDLAKHRHFLVKMLDEMKSEGFLKAQIKDDIAYDEKSKTVSVTVKFDMGPRYKIENVSVLLTAPHKELQSEITNLFETALLGKYAEKILIKAAIDQVKDLLAKRGYADAQITLTSQEDDKKISLALSFKIELAEKKEYLFKGNQFFSINQLLEEIVPLQAQGISLPAPLIAQDLEALYKKRGFLDAHVEAQEKPGIITFIIREGLRSKVGPITYKIKTFKGKNDSVTSDPQATQVLKKLKTDVEALSFYDEDLIDQLIYNSTRELAGYGYWDAVIKRCENRGQDNCLVLEIDLGKKRIITDIVIEGYADLLKEALFKRWVLLKKPVAIGPQDIEEQRKWLQSYFGRRGFLYATFKHQIVDTDVGPVLKWEIDTKKGPVRFSKTTITGLTKMRPEIVMRELCYKEGEPLSREKIEESAQRLKRLGMFESISIAPSVQPQGIDQDVQPMLIRCIEDDPFEIRTRLGFAVVSKSFTHVSWSTFRVGGSFLWKNPTGIADRLCFDVDLTWYTRNLALTYEVPWLGPCPIRTQFRVYSDRFDQPLTSSNQRLYKEEHDGLSVTFNHQHPWWVSCFKMGFELNKLSGISRRLAQVIQFEPSLIDKRTPYLYVEPTVTFEHIDNKADPCKGFYTALSLKGMVPPGVRNGWFLKALIEQSFYYPLFCDVIGALRWRFGHIFNACFSTILPTERFYLGGCSLRGYEPNMVPPLNDVTCDNQLLWIPVGGKTMANINAEIRFPIYKRLSGVVFTDMGALAQDRFADIAANKWLGASGFGIRLATPVGPIRFDIGWKWKKRDPRDKSYAWFLTLGHAF